jgi:hypothetical protein
MKTRKIIGTTGSNTDVEDLALLKSLIRQQRVDCFSDLDFSPELRDAFHVSAWIDGAPMLITVHRRDLLTRRDEAALFRAFRLKGFMP